MLDKLQNLYILGGKFTIAEHHTQSTTHNEEGSMTVQEVQNIEVTKSNFVEQIIEELDTRQRISKLNGPQARIALHRITEGDSIQEAVHYAEWWFNNL